MDRYEKISDEVMNLLAAGRFPALAKIRLALDRAISENVKSEKLEDARRAREYARGEDGVCAGDVHTVLFR